MPLYITQQIVMFDSVLYPGDVIYEGPQRERALEQQGWGIYVDEEQLDWLLQQEEEFANAEWVNIGIDLETENPQDDDKV